MRNLIPGIYLQVAEIVLCWLRRYAAFGSSTDGTAALDFGDDEQAEEVHCYVGGVRAACGGDFDAFLLAGEQDAGDVGVECETLSMSVLDSTTGVAASGGFQGRRAVGVAPERPESII